jgi:hypothetical protein
MAAAERRSARSRQSGVLGAVVLLAASGATLGPGMIQAARSAGTVRVLDRIGLDTHGEQPLEAVAPAITPDGRYVAYIVGEGVDIAHNVSTRSGALPAGQLASLPVAQPGTDAATEAVRYCSGIRRPASAVAGSAPHGPLPSRRIVVRLDRANGHRVAFTPTEVPILPGVAQRLSISDDGSLVAFGDSTDQSDGLASTHLVTVVSWDHTDQPIYLQGSQPSLSGDGRTVARVQLNSCTHVPQVVVANLDKDHDGVAAEGPGDVTDTFVSPPTAGTAGALAMPVLTGDAHILAFTGNVPAPPGPDAHPLTLVDLTRNTPTPVLLRTRIAGGNPVIQADWPSISRDGRFLAFASGVAYAPVDGNGGPDEYLALLDGGVPVDGGVQVGLASLTGANGVLPHGIAFPGTLSPDGGYVGFATKDPATSDDRTDGPSLYVRALATGATDLIDLTATGHSPSDGEPTEVALDDGAQRVAFTSTSSDLVPPDRNRDDPDVYLRTFAPGPPVTKPTTRPTTPNTSPPGATSLVVDPPIGRPGSVSTATGTGWGGCGTVTLGWVTGTSTQPLAVVRGGAADTFTVPVVVFAHETLGPRSIVASCAGKPDARAAFLLVPGSIQPSHFLGRR